MFFLFLIPKVLMQKSKKTAERKKPVIYTVLRQAVHLAVGLDVQGLTRADKPTSNFHDYLKGLLLSKRKY